MVAGFFGVVFLADVLEDACAAVLAVAVDLEGEAFRLVVLDVIFAAALVLLPVVVVFLALDLSVVLAFWFGVVSVISVMLLVSISTPFTRMSSVGASYGIVFRHLICSAQEISGHGSFLELCDQYIRKYAMASGQCRPIFAPVCQNAAFESQT